MIAGVAAGHPATAAAGLEILEDGGSAADAAVAACLASCVAETVMTGLLGGGHGLWWDGSRARLLDCFVAVPSRLGPMVQLPVPFGEEVVHYAIGPASCGVPGLPAGLDALWREAGRLPWRRLVEPALRLARAGVPMPPAHAACLAMLGPVMTLWRGAAIYAPGGQLLQEGQPLDQPGLVDALEALAAEGAAAAYSGSLADALLAFDGVGVTRGDLAGYEAHWSEPLEVTRGGRRWLTRGGLSQVPALLERVPPAGGHSPARRAVSFVEALATEADAGHTTNLVTVDADGCACVLTTSLGLGSGDFLPGLDLHLNSMLGEADLVRGPHAPGERMESMMAPSLVLDGDGAALAIGAAGGTRLGAALVSVATAVLEEGADPVEAVERPRLYAIGPLVHAEPGFGDGVVTALEAAGRTVRLWPALHHYFGGVSLSSRAGLAADPRRSGAAVALGT